MVNFVANDILRPPRRYYHKQGFPFFDAFSYYIFRVADGRSAAGTSRPIEKARSAYRINLRKKLFLEEAGSAFALTDEVS